MACRSTADEQTCVPPCLVKGTQPTEEARLDLQGVGCHLFDEIPLEKL